MVYTHNISAWEINTRVYGVQGYTLRHLSQKNYKQDRVYVPYSVCFSNLLLCLEVPSTKLARTQVRTFSLHLF